MVKKIVGFIGLLTLTSFAQATTEFQKIVQINYNGDSNDLFFIATTGKWGDPACPNAAYVHIKPTTAGRQQILSIGLAAYMAGKKVQFWGTCDTSAAAAGNYFDAMYIVVSD